MKKYIVWLKTEYKRAALVLPGLFVKAIIPLVIIGMILSYAQKNDAFSAKEKGTVGVVAPEGAAAELALNFVESMGAVEQNFNLVRIKEEDIVPLLEEKEIVAAVCVPDQVMENILYGEMVELSMYVPETTDVNNLVFTEIMKTGVGALTMAQGEIYATRAIIDKYGQDPGGLGTMYNEINKKNLNIYLNRAGYFKVRQLSVTENTGYTNYYTAAFFVLYCLFSGLFVTGYAKRTETEMKMLKKRLGISYMAQYLGRTLVLTTLLLIPISCYFLMIKLPVFHTGIEVLLSGKAILTLLFCAWFTAFYILFFYTIVENKRTVMLPLVVSALVFGYLSGCILPLSTLPNIIKKIAGFLPFNAMRMLVQDIAAGKQGTDLGALVIMLVGMIAIFLAGLWILCSRQKNFGGAKNHVKAMDDEKGEKDAERRIKKSMLGSSLFGITWKRTLRTKSIWICLLLTLALSLTLTGMERESKISVKAVAYVEDESLAKLLEEYEGLVQFELLPNEAMVREKVLQNKAECGYILKEDVADLILNEEGEWSIPVYENAGATMTDVVNEVVFERLFFLLSSGWFENYLCEHENFKPLMEELGEKKFAEEIKSTLYDEMHFGQTFGVKVFYVGEKIADEENSAGVSFYPGRLLALLCVLVCAFIGLLQVLADKAEHRVYKRSKGLISLYTVLHPTVLGIITAILIFLC
ncbi:MAG: ABC transporter permease [Lachnospiraceae bacterium]